MQVRNIFTKIICVIFGMVTLYLYLLTSHTTTMIEGWEGRALAYNVPDTPWYSIGASIFIVGIIIVAKKSIKFQWKSKIDITIVMCVIYALTGIIFAIALRPKIMGESVKIFAVATQMHAGDFSWFEPYEYMYRYRYLTGMVMCVYDLVGVFKSAEVANLAMIIISVISVSYSIWCVGQMARLVLGIKKQNSRHQIVVVFLYILFIPLFFYSLNSYPIALSTALCMISMYRYMEFIYSYKLRYAILSAFSLGMGVILKTNCKIVLIAMICFTLVYILHLVLMIIGNKEKEDLKRIGIVVIGIAIVVIGSLKLNIIPEKHCEKVIGHELSEGMPMTAWMAMGMNWGEAGPGTYNGESVELYEMAGHDKKATNDLAIQELKDILKEYKNKPCNLLYFWAYKVSMQWGASDYQCTNVVRTSREDSPWWINFYQSVIGGRVKVYIERISNLMFSIILIGTLLYLIFNKTKNWNQMLYAILIIGGFIVFMIWESAPRYVLPYVIMYIPFCCNGYSSVASMIEHLASGECRCIGRNTIAAWSLIIVILLIIYIFFHNSTLFSTIVELRSSDEQLVRYSEIVASRLSKG